jgi:uncharacterized protein YjbJ (UPF0337 family)
MSFLDKVRSTSKAGRGQVKQRVGRVTGNRRLQADGLGDRLAAWARQLVSRLKDAGQGIRRSLQH